jgi:hypothetical protein
MRLSAANRKLMQTYGKILTALICAILVGACTMVTPAAKPAYVTALEAAYGAPSQAGFGSAVFYEQSQEPGNLEQAAQAQYRYFVGELWERYGEDAWMGSWQMVYTRPPGAEHAIVAELRAIEDRSAAQSVELILDEAADPQAAAQALRGAFDDPTVSELAVYKIGDGAQMAGLLVAARRESAGESIMLVFLLD